MRPRKIMSDFELPARNACKEIWSDIHVFGCNFHYAQALRRKAKSIPQLSRLLMQNRNASIVLKMFMRLSLLPVNRVQNGMRVSKNI